MLDFVKYQAHDFSMRGQTSLESAMASGAGHLLSFYGTDTVPALDWIEEYYDADPDEIIGVSCAAGEHSIMQTGFKENERETIRRLITEVCPTGIVSFPTDTWDHWNVIANLIPSLKDEIMSRDGKVVARPDSGHPVKILCGDNDYSAGSPEHKGVIECFWDTFGGIETPEKCHQLDPHIGAIYGDSMSEQMMKDINERLWEKRFASTNYVGGVGSFFFQFVTRDTFSSAVKNTSVVINDVRTATFKDPKTDDGTKRSARGLLRVNADLTLSEDVTEVEENEGLLETVFLNSELKRRHKFSEIRARLMAQV
jgi:nicotinamide phosphoribosyltransferase